MRLDEGTGCIFSKLDADTIAVCMMLIHSKRLCCHSERHGQAGELGREGSHKVQQKQGQEEIISVTSIGG